MSVSYRIALAADRMTERRLGRERKDDTEDDEEWDMEWAQAVEDAKELEADRWRERNAETKRIRAEDARQPKAEA